ncbi:chemotaxis protein CheA [Glaciecola sp. MH2013]|uniref:chemotaxis protein CheA n=1 Tax=Glaciecola sp. MH2013 TaxID=2785524 RepID=UPI0018A07EC9|nr:chemotaxis protein CheA [Glaciecola sp. MH2013]MBF7074324.1 chemotaxis protein CheA [Glaciecola sp. MH2013]
MSVDMSQFFGVFFEESHEHLEDMEHLLMELSLDSPDPEDLNSIFRAAHSIKGGSGVFGFDALTGLTHVMENILDLARKDELTITKPIVDQLLITVDTLKNILECYQNEDDIDWDSIEKGTVELEALLKKEGEQAATDDDEDDGFGFFDVPVQDDDDDFGFFEPLDEPVEQEEKGYGIYADEDAKKAAEGAVELDDEDDGFGFFDDEPSEAVEASATTENTNEDPAASQQKDNVKTTKTPVEQKPAAAAKEVASRKTAPKRTAKKTEVKESSSIRVDTMKIDSLVNLVGELVITQSMIKIVGKDVHGEVEEKLEGAIGELSRNIREIQEAVMSMRMLPMSFAFNRFPRVVRDLADKLAKDIELVIEGGATEIDKGMIEKLVDPLTHLIRNSVDHGVEMPDEREAAGKPRKGTVVLNAEQRGGSIIISITDDGAGLNRDKILEKALANGLDVAPDIDDSQVWQLIFEPGFSTAEAVTDVSGRGVGMDVVRRNIESIGGSVEIESVKGEGSVFRIRLPLTLAIVDGMCVAVNDQTFVIPLTNIIESMQPSAEQIKTIGNDRLLWVREEYWPLVPLHELMEIDGAITDPSNAIVVLVETSRKRFGLLVDGLEGQQQVVIKSLEQHYKRVAGVAGATIMGDGGVALILDIESIASVVTIPNQQTHQSEVSVVG